MHTTSDRNYPWAMWANGQTWMLRQGTHFTSTMSHFRNETYRAATRLGKQVECKVRGKILVVRFFNSVRNPHGSEQ